MSETTNNNEIELQVSGEYLKKNYSKGIKRALVEIIGNALDADAKNINITLQKNPMGSCIGFTVEDDGIGLSRIQADGAFGTIGPSWKGSTEKTDSGRRMIGKNGEGRVYIINIASSIVWQSKYKDSTGKVVGFKIINENSKKGFTKTDEISFPAGEKTGMTVSVTQISQTLLDKFDTNKLIEELTIHFAPYLREYEAHNIQIRVDGRLININDALECPPIDKAIEIVDEESGQKYDFKMQIFHWKDKSIGERLFCSKDFSVVHADKRFGFQKKDFGCSVYINGDYIDENKNSFELLTGTPLFDAISSEVNSGVVSFYREILAKKSRKTVDELKSEGAYPYHGEPKTVVEEREREIYDIILHQVASVDKFSSNSIQSKQLITNLLKEAIERDVSSVFSIMKNVLAMEDEQIEHLDGVINQYGLPYIIKLARIVADKISFIRELRLIIQDPTYSKSVLERQHIHKILEKELWVFGDGYTEGTSDRNMRDVLEYHVKSLGRDKLIDEVALTDLSKDRPDLCISRQYAQTSMGCIENLVVELKRPSLVISDKEISQLKKYAFQVYSDHRFDKDRTKWVFKIVGNELDEQVKEERKQAKIPNCIIDYGPNCRVYVQAWSEILQELDWKYTYLQDKIETEAPDADSFSYIKENFPDILSSIYQKTEERKNKKENKKKSKK